MSSPSHPSDKGARSQSLFDNTPVPLLVYDRKSLKFMAVNQAALERYGYTRAEFLSRSLMDIRRPEATSRVLESVSKRNHSGAHSGVCHHRAKDGRMFEVEVQCANIRYKGRDARLAVILDATNRISLEDQLRQAQRMEAVGMLAGGVAHDFNNLLTIITGYSQMLLNSLSVQDSNRASVEQIMKAGERAAALTRQLLAFSRRQRLQPKILDLNQLVTSLGLMLRRLIGEDVDLRLALGSDLGRVKIDPGQIEQVIMNLVINARDAMPRGGTLTVETSNITLDETYAAQHLTVQPGSYVLLAVSDTGLGMTPETRNRLFEPFFTTKGPGKGTGLGMSTVFGIVKQSRGSIGVYSEVGKGTTVKIYLPSIGEAAPIEAEHVQTHAARGTETILLVEDEDMVRKLVRETLEREGYTLLDAAGADEAHRICESYKGLIHLMITDVVMPQISGRELADRVALLRPEMKVLYMSGYTDNAILNSGVLNNTANFLQKPFSPQVLARKVREILEGSDQEKTRLAGGE